MGQFNGISELNDVNMQMQQQTKVGESCRKVGWRNWEESFSNSERPQTNKGRKESSYGFIKVEFLKDKKDRTTINYSSYACQSRGKKAHVIRFVIGRNASNRKFFPNSRMYKKKSRDTRQSDSKMEKNKIPWHYSKLGKS